MKYCESIYQTKRWKSRVVPVGNVNVGGDNPIRIQSMTTSDTRDIEATIDQIMKLSDHGCEIARVTVQGKKEAFACEGIKSGLIQKGYTIPLVADIHFYPPAAMIVADYADKVRVNPGNFVDRRATFRVIEYNDETYASGIEKIEEKFSPLVEKCKNLKRAMRIGTNHGSLSDRIMNRYGDTPRGMVESALEFARVCRKLDYHDIIFSMKASNTVVMIEAYRLLVAEMMKLGWDYPLHLGVTEAGEGEDGRVKSSIGIGSLLLDGLGDTIRVSLTEDPWKEIDPCKRLIQSYENWKEQSFKAFEETTRDFQDHIRRSVSIKEPLHRDGSVLLKVSEEDLMKPDFFSQIGCKVQLNQPEKTLSTVDAIFIDSIPKAAEEILVKLQKIGVGILSREKSSYSFLVEPLQNCETPDVVEVNGEEENWEKLKEIDPVFILFRPKDHFVAHARRFFEWLRKENLSLSVLFSFTYDLPTDDLIIRSSSEIGALLSDGLGEGICIESKSNLEDLSSLSFSILQGCRMRTIKTEFISCPGCGRTLFDLQDVAKGIREKTEHLPGVKIAIMGCIVNGPGEMADADFGYVGSKPDMIDLYVGKTCVERNIPHSEAVEKLVDLIKAHGRWVEPEILEETTV